MLFNAGVDAYQQKQFAVAATSSYCSNLLEHDRSALWNQLMAQMQIALQSQHYEQLNSIGLQCLEMPTQSPSDNTDKGNVHYLLGTSFSKSGNATWHNLALDHLKQATRLLPNSAAVLHSLATYQHQYNQTMDPQRFTRPQHMGVQQACVGSGSNGNIIHSSDPRQEGDSKRMEHLNYSVHRSVIVFGSMSSISVRMQSSCTFLFPTRSFRLSPPVTMAPPSAMHSIFSKSFDQLGLAISFAPKNYYMLLTDSLPRAYLLKNVPHLLIPPLYSNEMQQLFSLLIGRTTISYNSTQSYYVKRLHTVDWNWNTNPLKTTLPNRVVLQLRRAMQASNILQMGRLKMPHTRSLYQLVYVEREAAFDTRVLMPPLNKDSILRMLWAQEDSHMNVNWNITHHQTNQKRTLLELVESFNNADIVVGIHGAGLSNILFSPVHKRCILVELTPKEDVFYNRSSYKHYIELARSINTVTHLSVGMFDMHEFSTATIQRTPRMNHLLQQVLQLAASVVVASSAIQGHHHHHRTNRIDRIAGTRAETLGVGHHRAGNISQAMCLYQVAESLQHKRPSVLVRRNKASIAYDEHHIDYAISQLLGLRGRIDRAGMYQLDLMKKQQIYLQTNNNALYTTVLPPTPVPSFEYGSLSYNIFYHQYWKQKTPVVFRNAIQKLMTVNLTLEDIIQSECGAKLVDLFHHVDSSPEWAGLEKIGGQTKKLSSFLLTQQEQQGPDKEQESAYCVDFSIGRQCPALLQNIGFRMPRYVKDHLQNIGQTYKTHQKNSKKNNDIEKFVDHWPSLFVGRNGTKSGLHKDSIGSFWQLVVSGKKHWTMIDEHHHNLLEPDALRRTFSRTSFETVPRWEVIVEPGDLLMVPSNSAHSVVNVADSVALAGNFVDSMSYSDVVAELTLGTGIAPGYESLLAAFDTHPSVRNGRNRFAEEEENADTDFLWRDLKKLPHGKII